MSELREFVCTRCGHTVVVRPTLPADYTPNMCTPCYEKQQIGFGPSPLLMQALIELHQMFLDISNDKTASPGPALRKLERQQQEQKENRDMLLRELSRDDKV